MPHFTCLPEKIFLDFFGGGASAASPPSPTPMVMQTGKVTYSAPQTPAAFEGTTFRQGSARVQKGGQA